MLLRVRDFGKAQQDLFSNSPYGQQALAAVGRAIDQIETFTTARTIVALEVRNQQARRSTIMNRMRTIARTSRRVVLPSGEKLRLRLPRKTSYVAVAAAARSFLEQAEPRQEEFVKFGLPSSCLTDLRQTLAELEGAMSDRRLGRSGIALAKQGIRQALADGARAVRDVDVVVRNVVGDEPMVAAWERDMRIVEGTHKRRAADEAPVAADEASVPADEASVPAVETTVPAVEPAADAPAPPAVVPDASPTPAANGPGEVLGKAS